MLFKCVLATDAAVDWGERGFADSNELSVVLVPVARNLKRESKFTHVYNMTLYMWGVGVAPLIFNFGIKWRRVVSLNPRLLYPRERALNSLYWSPGGSQCPI